MEEIFRYKNFRVCPITRFGLNEFERVKIQDGLAIEHAYNDQSSCVIAFVYPNLKDGGVYYEPIGDRVEQSTPDWESVKIFRICLEIAKHEIEEAQKNEEDYE